MIDPKDFIKIEDIDVGEIIKVSGNFICQECFVSVDSAAFNEDEMLLVYTCSDGHVNKATL